MYTRDESHYFTLITIRVEDCVFRVPRHGFEEQSDVFRNMFSMPTGHEFEEESEQEGGSDENPIRIDGVDKQSFKDLLTVLYPRPCDFKSPGDCLRTKKVDELLRILRLADMWEFREIRALAISNLKRMPLTDVQNVYITDTLDIQDWYDDERTKVMRSVRAIPPRWVQAQAEDSEPLGGCVDLAYHGQSRTRTKPRTLYDHRRLNSCAPVIPERQAQGEILPAREDEQRGRNKVTDHASLPVVCPEAPPRAQRQLSRDSEWALALYETRMKKHPWRSFQRLVKSRLHRRP